MSMLSDLRKKYPQYNDMPDQELADSFHKKYYSDMPKEHYYSKIGFQSPKSTKSESNNDQTSFLEDIAIKSAEAIPEIASMVMNLPSEAYGAIRHPLQTLKNIPIGLAEGAASAFNLPGQLTKYAANKGYIPEALAKYAPQIPVEKIEEQLGIKPQESGEALTRGLSGFGLWGKLGKFGEASNLKKAALGAGYSAGSGQNPIAGAILGSIPGLIEKGQKAYEYIKEPGKAVNQSKEVLEHIQNLLSKQKEMGENESTHVSRFMNQVQEGLTNQHQNLQSQLPELFPIKPKSETRLNLNTATHENIRNLEESFNNRYSTFEKEFGNESVNEPFDFHNIKLDNLPHVSLTTKKMAYGTSNDRLTYTNSEGEPVEINFPPDNGSVNDYVNFSRELRDAAFDASKAAKNATHGEAMSLRRTSNRLRQLQGQAEERIHSTIGDEAYNQFKQIQKDYSQLMGPVKTEPAIYNAAYKKKISDKLHDTLLQPVNEQLRNYLYESPDFTNALKEHLMQGTKHPLRQTQSLNPASIDYDVQHLLSPEQLSALNESAQMNQAQQHLNEVSKHIKSLETLTPQQEQAVHQFHPETSNYLSNEAQRRAIIKQLEHEKTKETISKKEKEKKHHRQKQLLTIGGTVLGATQLPNISKLIRKLF